MAASGHVHADRDGCGTRARDAAERQRPEGSTSAPSIPDARTRILRSPRTIATVMDARSAASSRTPRRRSLSSSRCRCSTPSSASWLRSLRRTFPRCSRRGKASPAVRPPRRAPILRACGAQSALGPSDIDFRAMVPARRRRDAELRERGHSDREDPSMHPFPKDRSVPIHRTFHLSLTAAAGLLLAAFGSTSAPADDAVPAATPAQPPGQPPAAGPPAPADSKVPTTLKKVVVSADLNQAREDIAPALGATGYAIAPSQIEVVPGGSNAPLQQVLLRAPGVVEDSWGTGARAGRTRQPHLSGERRAPSRAAERLRPERHTQSIDSVNLITGSLPAQFGFHTAGIVDVLTKSGESLSGSDLSIYGGSFSTIRPSFETGGTSGPLDYFVTGSYSHERWASRIRRPLATPSTTSPIKRGCRATSRAASTTRAA